MQLTKLGLIAPEGCLPPTLRASFQLLWANNGDTISKQYAGTNALKVRLLLFSSSILLSRALIIRTWTIRTVNNPDSSQGEKSTLLRQKILDAIVTNHILQHVLACPWQECWDRERFQCHLCWWKWSQFRRYWLVVTLDGKYGLRQLIHNKGFLL